MKPVIRYQSRLLFRKSYKPKRLMRFRPGVQTSLVFRPSRAGPGNDGVSMNTETQSPTMADVAVLD
jgi:hypothetical protein